MSEHGEQTPAEPPAEERHLARHDKSPLADAAKNTSQTEEKVGVPSETGSVESSEVFVPHEAQSEAPSFVPPHEPQSLSEVFWFKSLPTQSSLSSMEIDGSQSQPVESMEGAKESIDSDFKYSVEMDSVTCDQESVSPMDVDSGIENSELEEVDRKAQKSDTQKESSQECLSEADLLQVVSRVFHVSWKEQGRDVVYLPGLATEFAKEPEQVFSNTEVPISQVLVEVLTQHACNGNPFASLSAGELAVMTAGASGNQSAQSSSHQPTLSLIATGNQCSSQPTNPAPEMLSYLLQCYERVKTEENMAPKRYSQPPYSRLASTARQLCVNFFALVLQGAFSPMRPGPASSLLVPLLFDRSLPRGFLWELVVATSQDDDSFSSVFTPLVNGLVQEIHKHSLDNDGYKAPLSAMNEIFKIKIGNTRPICKLAMNEICKIKIGNARPICKLMTTLPEWLPDVLTEAGGREVEKLSLLGAFLSLSVFAEDNTNVVEKYFSGPMLTQDSIRILNESLQHHLHYVRHELHDIIHSILDNVESREAMVMYLATAIGRNQKRAQMQVDESLVAGDGYMLNLLVVLHKLSEKIRLDKVDVMYPHHPKSLVDISQDTRLKATSQEVTDWVEKCNNQPGRWQEPKFPTQCYFLTLHCQHLALMPACRHYMRRIQEMQELGHMVEEMQSQEVLWKGTPHERQNQQLLEERKSEIKKLHSAKLCGDVGLLDETLLRNCFQFYGTVMVLLLDMLKPKNQEIISLPLPKEVPMEFAALPEHYIEDIAEFILFTVQHCPQALEDMAQQNMVLFIVVVICSAHCIRNPYLVAKMVEINRLLNVDNHPGLVTICSAYCISNPYLVAKMVKVVFVLSPDVQPRTAKIYEAIQIHPLAIKHLVPALMTFYTDVEQIGASSDKLSIRYHISIILKSLWKLPMHQNAMIEFSGSQAEFVRFINMLINDTNFLLEESLACLKRIHEVQEAMKNQESWNTLDQEERQSKACQLATDEKQCRFYLTLTNETLEMFNYLTEDIQKPFLRPELCDQLAAMLNFNLRQLCGPKCSDLKVENRDKYGFEPRTMLDQLATIYLHLDSEELAIALANDERSFQPGLVKDALNILSPSRLKTPSEIKQFSQLMDRAQEINTRNQQLDLDYVDAPDEFIDPVMNTIMQDPVILPSGDVMERKVIEHHLLNSQTNPFTRQELTSDMLVPATDLKKKIVDWIQAKKTKL